MKINKLIVYKDFCEEDILHDMNFMLENYDNEYYNQEDLQALLYDCINRLLDLTSAYGFEGNLWKMYMVYLMINNENSYSKACEINGDANGSIKIAALHDLDCIRALFNYDFTLMQERLDVEALSIIFDYQGTSSTKKLFNKKMRERIGKLASKLDNTDTVEAFMDEITKFYKTFGVGKFGLHKAFRIEEKEGETQIVPIHNIAKVELDDLVGYDIAKQKLSRNTKAFVEGRVANNCLLFGDSGTGKSTAIKAILNQYYEDGLRMIEVYKHQFQLLNDVIAQIKNRNYRFIIYMDDLSFEEFEIEYKYLKAVIEGGLEKKPDNVLIYATSNRRHLVREEFADKIGRRDDLHASDTVQEKLSLAARFGESIFFNGPSKKEFQEIVLGIAKKEGIKMEREELLLEANKWELSHGGLSGRTARQFIDYIKGIVKEV